VQNSAIILHPYTMQYKLDRVTLKLGKVWLSKSDYLYFIK
jgi:hypothetical protein